MHTQTVHAHAVVNTVASIACTHQRRHRVYMLGIIIRLPMWLLYRVYVCGRPTWPPVCMILVWLSSSSTHGKRVWLHSYTVLVQDLTNTFCSPRVAPIKLQNMPSSQQHTYMRQDNLHARDVMLNKNTHAQQSVQLWWLGPNGWCRLCRKLVTAKERRLPHNDECVYTYMLCLQFTCVLQSDWCIRWITKVRSCTELLYKWSQTLLPWVEGLARQTNMIIIETYISVCIIKCTNVKSTIRWC